MWKEILDTVHLHGVINTNLLGEVCVVRNKCASGSYRFYVEAVIPVDLQLAAERRGLVITINRYDNIYQLRKRK